MMSMSPHDPFRTLNLYLDKLDEAPTGGNQFFRSEDRKERYETGLMYAFRKLEAARYHKANIRRHLADDTNRYKALQSPKSIAVPPGGRMKSSVHMSADHYVFELSAFFEAMKSCLDFLSIVAVRHLRGVTGDSIRVLIGFANSPENVGPLIETVRRYLDWLVHVRDYRHHLVHRMVITAISGHESHRHGDAETHVTCPVCVPQSTPKYVSDTRADRMMADAANPPGIMRFESHTTVTGPNGREIVTDFSVKLEPAPGYAEIGEFVESHLARMEAFFAETITAMDAIGFVAAPYRIPKITNGS